MKIITKFEHESISLKDFENEMDFRKFEEVCRSINKKYSDSGNAKAKDSIFSFLSKKIKLKQYVGVIQFEKDKYVEILPKSYSNQSAGAARKFLSRLLSIYLGINPKVLEKVELNYDTFSVLDIFIAVFINEISKIMKQGIRKKYVRVKGKSKYIKGKLVLSQQVRNFYFKNRFFTEHEELTANIAENIILKTALLYLKNKTSSRELRKKINQLLLMFSEISHTVNYENCIKQIYIDRTFHHYNYAVKLAKIFLSGKSFIPVAPSRVEKEEALSLLFDMNLLFQNYVAHILKKKFGERLSIQNGEYYLLDDFQTGKKKFKLVPDMVLRGNQKLCIIDAKWKKLDQGIPSYKIDRSDLYQMFTYASIYQKENPIKKINVILIYPRQEKFDRILRFRFRSLNNIKLYVIPFDLDKT